MSDRDRRAVRSLVGRHVHLATLDGTEIDGQLLSCTTRSVWVLAGDEDCFVPLDSVAVVRAA